MWWMKKIENNMFKLIEGILENYNVISALISHISGKIWRGLGWNEIERLIVSYNCNEFIDCWFRRKQRRSYSYDVRFFPWFGSLIQSTLPTFDGKYVYCYLRSNKIYVENWILIRGLVNSVALIYYD